MQYLLQYRAESKNSLINKIRVKADNPFDIYSREYEEWFVKNPHIFRSELKALSVLLPSEGRGLEIGVGSGLFAEKLKISHGTDPSLPMLELAEKRGIIVKQGIAENIPWPDNFFDYAAFITSLCFINDRLKALEEAGRVLKPQGILIIAFIDRDSEAGRIIMSKKQKSKFYKDADLLTQEDIKKLLEYSGFKIEEEESSCRKEPCNFTVIKSVVKQKSSQKSDLSENHK